MAGVHARAARAAGAKLGGIVSSRPEKSLAAAAILGIDRAFDSLEALLGDESITVVHVCTPNALHAEQALAIIAAGKHVVCEKPLAVSAPEAEELVVAAREAAVVATVPFVYRFHPMVREARARVHEGEVGRLFSIHGSYLQDWLVRPTEANWRVDAAAGGPSRAFADIGSHLVDLVEFITTDRVARVAATKRTFFADRAGHTGIATEDAASVVFETAGGAIGTLSVSQVAPGRKNSLSLEIAGSGQSIRFDQENPDTLWIGREAANQVIARDAAHLHADAARLSIVPAGHPQGYQDAFNGFAADTYAAITGEPPDGLPVFDDGLRAVRVTAAVIEAATVARWVEIAGD